MCAFSRFQGQGLPSNAEPCANDHHPGGLRRLGSVRRTPPDGKPQTFRSQQSYDHLQPQHGFTKCLHCV